MNVKEYSSKPISNESNLNTRTGTYDTLDKVPLNRPGRVQSYAGRQHIEESKADTTALNVSMAQNPNAPASVHQDAIGAATGRTTRAKSARFRNTLLSIFSERGREALEFTPCKWLLTFLKLVAAVIAFVFAVVAKNISAIVLSVLGIFIFATEQIIDSIEISE